MKALFNPATSVLEFTKGIRQMSAQAQVLEVASHFMGDIIKKSGVRDMDQIFTFLVESSYEVLPLPIRMIIKKEVYVQTIGDQKTKLLQVISEKLAN